MPKLDDLLNAIPEDKQAELKKHLAEEKAKFDAKLLAEQNKVKEVEAKSTDAANLSKEVENLRKELANEKAKIEEERFNFKVKDVFHGHDVEYANFKVKQEMQKNNKLSFEEACANVIESGFFKGKPAENAIKSPAIDLPKKVGQAVSSQVGSDANEWWNKEKLFTSADLKINPDLEKELEQIRKAKKK